VKKSYDVHRAHGKRPLAFYIVTVSSSRYSKMKQGLKYKDESGDLIERSILKESHAVAKRMLISDRRVMIRSATNEFIASKADVLVFTGGTGVSPTDITVETVVPLLEKELPGFGELLRYVSFDRIGGAAMLTRATAGIVGGKLIVCLPGSPDAVDTALRNFMSEFPHIVSVAQGG